MELGTMSPSLVVLSVLAVYLLGKASQLLTNWIATQRKLSAIPKPETGHWLWGHLQQFADRKNMKECRWRWMMACPRIHRISLAHITSLVILPNAEVAHTLLMISPPKNKKAYSLFRSWLGNGLVLSEGRKWARDRRLLSHCFRSHFLRTYVHVYRDTVKHLLEKWQRACDGNESVDVTDSVTLLTLDIILRCAMGFKSNCQHGRDATSNKAAQYVKSVQAVAELLERRLHAPLYHIDFIYQFTADGKEYARHLNVAHEMSRYLVAERKAALDKSVSSERRNSHDTSHCKDFLDVLLTVVDETGVGLSDEEVREQVDTFLFAGHDTTSSALQWTIHYLAQHETLQEQCRREVLDVLDEGDGTSGQIEHGHLAQMTYLTQFIKESLRLSCPVPFISRQLANDTELAGHVIPAGVQTSVSILNCHMHPHYWTDSRKFDPDRFSPEMCQGRHPSAYIPFSGGARNCIGQSFAMDEMKTTLALVLKSFKIMLDPNEPEPEWRPRIVSWPHRNIKVRLANVTAGC